MATDRPTRAAAVRLADSAGAMLGYAELARHLSIGLRTCKRLVAKGALPAPDLRIGGRIVRWRRSTIERWIDRAPGRGGER